MLQILQVNVFVLSNAFSENKKKAYSKDVRLTGAGLKDLIAPQGMPECDGFPSSLDSGDNVCVNDTNKCQNAGKENMKKCSCCCK